MADLGKITKIKLPNNDTVDLKDSNAIQEPAQDGTNGQVLITDGNGGRSWGNNYTDSVYIGTAAGTAAKVGTISAYTLRPGWLQVMVINSNTAASALTLNINSAGAKPIYINGAVSSATNYTLPAGIYLVNYDGTNYYFQTNSNLSLKNDSATDTYIKLSNNAAEIWLNVEPAGNRGIWDATGSKWLIYNPSGSTSTRIPGWANTGSSTRPVYFNSNGTPAVCEVADGWITWGGQNRNDSAPISPIDVSLNSELSNNRFAGLNPAGVTIEYKNSNTSTWSTYSTTALAKQNLFTTSQEYVVGGGDGITKNNYSALRITIDGVNAQIYNDLKKIEIYLSTYGSNGSKVTLESRSYADVSAGNDTWNTVINNMDVSGWSGWNTLNFTLPGSGCFGGTNKDTHQRQIRLTFTHSSISSNYSTHGLTIKKIRGYSINLWTIPSSEANTGAYLRLNPVNPLASAWTARTVSNRIFVGSTTPTSVNKTYMNTGDLYLYVP